MWPEKAEKYTYLRMVPCLLVMGAIFFLSHTPGDELALPPVAYSDKLCHGIAYAVLSATFLWGFSPRYRKSFPLQAAVFAVVFSFLYGCLDEFHQSFIPLRSPSIGDVVADTCGAIFCCIIWWFFLLKTEKTKRRKME